MTLLIKIVFLLMISWATQAAQDPFSRYEEILHSRVGSSQEGTAQSTLGEGSSAGDEKDLRLGACDLNLVFLMHPRMRDYNFLVQSFRAPLPAKLNVPAEFYLKQRNDQRLAFLKQLDSRKALFEGSQKKLESQIKQLRMEFEREITSLKSEPGAIRKIEIAEDRYFKSRMELEGQIQELVTNYRKWKAENTVEIYLPEPARNKLFRSISIEIQESLRKLSKTHGIDLIFNKPLKNTRASPLTPGNSFDYTTLANYENHFALLMRRPMAVGEGNAALSTRGLYRSMAPYFSNYEQIFQYFKPVLSQHLFLGQGRDLTTEVLSHLWRKYKIPDAKIDAMLEIVKSWSRD